MIARLIQCILVSSICLDVGISHIEKGNKPKAFYYFSIWGMYLITLIAI